MENEFLDGASMDRLAPQHGVIDNECHSPKYVVAYAVDLVVEVKLSRILLHNPTSPIK